MADKINNHPSIIHAKELTDICRPLEKLNITYFAHVYVDKVGQFSGVNNNPKFAERYLRKEYFNADIHLAKTDQLKNYFVWDSIECIGKSADLYKESCDHGVAHTFTIVEKTNDGSHYYHFANDQLDKTINQVYISNIDLLHLFILHFKDKINQSKMLSRVHDEFKFTLDENAAYTCKSNQIDQNSMRRLFLDEIELNKQIETGIGKPLSLREVEVLAWLHYGKTAREIAAILGVAEVTINKHILNIKNKTQCYTQFQLGELFTKLIGSTKEALDKILKR